VTKIRSAVGRFNVWRFIVSQLSLIEVESSKHPKDMLERKPSGVYIVKAHVRGGFYDHKFGSLETKTVECVVRADSEIKAREAGRQKLSRRFGRLVMIDSVREAYAAAKSDLEIDFLKPWYEMKIVAFDVETTGFCPDSDRVTEIGFSVYDKASKSFANPVSYLINEGAPLSKKIIELTGITPDMLEGKPDFKGVAGEVIKHIEEADILVAHNRGFDIAHVLKTAHRHGFSIDLPPVMCSMELSMSIKRHFPGKLTTPNDKLQTLVEYFDLQGDSRQAHRAGDDAMMCGNVFMKLARLHPSFLPPATLEDVVRFFDRTEWPS
jgi:DNA polymerase III epsilon subunit family exonuclease